MRSDALPLALVQPWLPPQSGRRIYLRGDVSLDAQIRPRGAAWEGHVEVRSKEGGVRLARTRVGAIPPVASWCAMTSSR